MKVNSSKRGEIFFPNFQDARRRVEESGGRFVYYTTAATAMLILQNREVWMRSTALMNDSSEIDHGLSCLAGAYQSYVGADLNSALDECIPGVSNRLQATFNSWIPIIKKNTYILSVSEHLRSEDDYGRLSMWRAYGGSAGVALVFRADPMLRESHVLGAYSSPVAYLSDSDFRLELKRLADGIRANREYVRSLGSDDVVSVMFEAFRFAAICTKHPAFKEEREWRVVSTLQLNNIEHLNHTCEVVGGVPQMVLKLKLQDQPEHGLQGLSLPALLDRILIGPCDHPDTVKDAFVDQLQRLRVPAGQHLVRVTGVPLRANQR